MTHKTKKEEPIEKRTEPVQFQLNTDVIWKNNEALTFNALTIKTEKAVAAILYLLSAMDISISKDLYDKMDNVGKSFFKAKKTPKTRRESGVFYDEDHIKRMGWECCDKCHDVTFEKTWPMHTAYHACTNLGCECHKKQ